MRYLSIRQKAMAAYTVKGRCMEHKANPLDETLAATDSDGPLADFSNRLNYRLIGFALITLALGLAFRDSLTALFQFSLKDETYSYMPLIPLVSGYLLFTGRRRFFYEVHWAWVWGALLAGSGAFLYFAVIHAEAAAAYRDHLATMALALLLIWFGGFVAFFGPRAFCRASFPLLFLFFIVPIPSVLLEKIVELLQQASTEVAWLLFQGTGLPVLRNGFQFELPGMSVVVAEQCCGIRSSLSLFITGVLAAYLGLNSPWRRGLLILSVLPITIFKNALRILTLALLGAYVDQRILDSVIHRAGGIPFFALALVLFGCVFWLLHRSEAKASSEGQP